MSYLLDAVSAIGTVASPAVAVWGMNIMNNRAKKKKSVDDAVNYALLQKSVVDLAAAFKKETGGNSGGFREKINSIDRKLDTHIATTSEAFADLTSKVDTATNEISFIKGTLAIESSN